ncbi:McrB family protein [uncultured Psychroserpens sp.]|uniref:McrB family protein n=1 Tax=uncultured Psychroserpens sp. TaxID=255436 RepID=UPI00261B5471|nr:AAA family ATPase [uncultured Psychroserpens sp.]
MSLKNLNNIAIETQTSFLNYKKEEIELSDNFKKLFTQIIENDGKQKVSFSKHTTVVFTSKELTITFPNQWYYIASYFVDYLSALFEYKNVFNEIFRGIANPKEAIAEIKKTNHIPQNIQSIINKYFSLEQDKEYFQKFLSHYDWWYGSKTIDRNDYFVSPILELASVVNNSQSYIADLAYHLTVNPNLSKLLNESEISEIKPKQFSKESLLINTEKYIEEKYTGRFVYKVLTFFYDYDELNNITPFFFKNNQSEYTSIKDKEIKLTSIFKTSEGILSKDELSFNDGKTRFFEDVIFRLEDENYYLSTEWTYGKDSRLDLDNFKILIENYYPDYSIYTENEVHYLSSKIEEKNVINKDKFDIITFQKICENSGLNYKPKFITRYIASLATKPFVLLSGLSGSGKTKLAQAFARWITEDQSQYCIVPVGADWTNREPLLGYVNALNNDEYIVPENGALKLLIEANKEINKSKPYFLILDEMNLSHVERYFADFLSIMESKDQLKLHSSNEKISGVDSNLNWPINLFIVGTVNVDETTYMFSPKVLDRANVIEFRVDKDDIEEFLKAPKNIDFSYLDSKGTAMGEDFITIASNKDFTTINPAKLNKKLVQFFEELKKTGAEFGYRSAKEIHRLYNQLTVLDNEIPEDTKIDIAIMQKLLPKLHGSRRKLCPILEVLASLCVSETTDASKVFLNNKETLVYKDNTAVLYPLSLEKITRMYKGAIDNGFASYAEA